MAPYPDKGYMLRMALLLEGGLIVLALILGWLLRTPPFAQMELDYEGWLWGLAATVPLLAAMLWATRTELDAVRRLAELVQTRLLPMFEGFTVLDFALVSLVAGIGEEALFRGVLQIALAEASTPAIGLLLASVLFGLCHLVTRLYAIAAGIVGLYLGWLLLATDNLLVPIVVHALYDFLALMYLARISRRGTADEQS